LLEEGNDFGKKQFNIKAVNVFFCGYDCCQAALDFHHLDASSKEFGISMDRITRSWERVQKELDKCVLACSNCHREIHAGILQPSVVMPSGNMGLIQGSLSNGNPEPSLTNGIKVVRKVQRLRVRSQPISSNNAPHPIKG